jgi:hypothetical protein
MNPTTTPITLAADPAIPASGSDYADRARIRPTTLSLARLAVALVAILLWLRGDAPVDDRGSESTEKAFMVILAIALGTAVSAAAVAFVATKTALFR